MCKFKHLSFLIFLYTLPLTGQNTISDSLFLVNSTVGDKQNRLISTRGIGDINGDGFDDFITTSIRDTSHYGKKRAIYKTNLFYGSESFDLTPDLIYDYSFIYPLGDVNNDNYDDLMIAETNYSGVFPFTTFKLLFGAAIPVLSGWTYTPPYLLEMVFSDRVEDIGDINGDGYRDFVISSHFNFQNNKGRAYIFLGGDTLETEPWKIIVDNSYYEYVRFFGASITGIGDWNKDGFDDILISAPTLDGSDSGLIYLFYGGVSLNDSANLTFSTPEFDYDYGRTIKNLEDIDKDGVNEFATSGVIQLNIDSSAMLYFSKGMNFGAGGDINNDGYNDFLINGFEYSNDNLFAVVKLFYGGEILDTLEDIKIYEEQPYSNFGYLPELWGTALDITGDINNDGYDDVLILAPRYRVDSISIGKVYIYSYSRLNNVSDLNPKHEDFYLSNNYPNPFNPQTSFYFNLYYQSRILIEMYNVIGEKIAILADEVKPAGTYSHKILTKDYNLKSGIYFIRMNVSNLITGKTTVRTLKAVVLK